MCVRVRVCMWRGRRGMQRALPAWEACMEEVTTQSAALDGACMRPTHVFMFGHTCILACDCCIALYFSSCSGCPVGHADLGAVCGWVDGWVDGRKGRGWVGGWAEGEGVASTQHRNSTATAPDTARTASLCCLSLLSCRSCKWGRHPPAVRSKQCCSSTSARLSERPE